MFVLHNQPRVLMGPNVPLVPEVCVYEAERMFATIAFVSELSSTIVVLSFVLFLEPSLRELII